MDDLRIVRVPFFSITKSFVRLTELRFKSLKLIKRSSLRSFPEDMFPCSLLSKLGWPSSLTFPKLHGRTKKMTKTIMRVRHAEHPAMRADFVKRRFLHASR